jgi:hypothetical protein
VTASVFFLSLIFILFTAKHVLADFVLQTSWMWRTKDKEHGWIAPLAAHAGCHAGFTLAVALVINPALWWLGMVDLLLHLARPCGARRTSKINERARDYATTGTTAALMRRKRLAVLA